MLHILVPDVVLYASWLSFETLQQSALNMTCSGLAASWRR